MKNQAHFNPLKFILSIVRDLKIYENTKILELRPDGVVTNSGQIIAKKIIVATHFPFINKHGGYFIKMYQHRSYVIALKNAPLIKDMYVDEAKKGLSFRSYEGYLLIGGGGHRTGKKGGGWNEIEDIQKKYYKGAIEEYRWATQDCMTLDSIPYIGCYSKNTPDLYVATGFNKWGMTSSMTAAMILSDLVSGKENIYSDVYSPYRSIFHPQLAVNSFESLMGMLTPTVPRCPHLGCALKYNKQEHTWDCPCHGSHFDENGELIDNPATDDKK
jgi:glycine/D-amino acid oxidase-like deaminating enzyme